MKLPTTNFLRLQRSPILPQDEVEDQPDKPEHHLLFPLKAYDCSSPHNIRDVQFKGAEECDKYRSVEKVRKSTFTILHEETTQITPAYACTVELT